MKHLKFLSCLVLAIVCLSLPKVSHAQWTRNGYIVLKDATVRNQSGSGLTQFGGGWVEASCGAGLGSADISVTYRVTWTWQNYGPSSSTMYTPKATVTGSVPTGVSGYATSGVKYTSISNSSDTANDGNPYASSFTGFTLTIQSGLFTYYDDITATAAVTQKGAVKILGHSGYREMPWAKRNSHMCKFDVGGTDAQSTVSFE